MADDNLLTSENSLPTSDSSSAPIQRKVPDVRLALWTNRDPKRQVFVDEQPPSPLPVPESVRKQWESAGRDAPSTARIHDYQQDSSRPFEETCSFPERHRTFERLPVGRINGRPPCCYFTRPERGSSRPKTLYVTEEDVISQIEMWSPTSDRKIEAVQALCVVHSPFSLIPRSLAEQLGWSQLPDFRSEPIRLGIEARDVYPCGKFHVNILHRRKNRSLQVWASVVEDRDLVGVDFIIGKQDIQSFHLLCPNHLCMVKFWEMTGLFQTDGYRTLQPGGCASAPPQEVSITCTRENLATSRSVPAPIVQAT